KQKGTASIACSLGEPVFFFCCHPVVVVVVVSVAPVLLLVDGGYECGGNCSTMRRWETGVATACRGAYEGAGHCLPVCCNESIRYYPVVWRAERDGRVVDRQQKREGERSAVCFFIFSCSLPDDDAVSKKRQNVSRAVWSRYRRWRAPSPGSVGQ
ncbi:unnamed protein product, partial [Pylaiella littoralis]